MTALECGQLTGGDLANAVRLARELRIELQRATAPQDCCSSLVSKNSS